jgi:lysophospholipase L1-like esterase
MVLALRLTALAFGLGALAACASTPAASYAASGAAATIETPPVVTPPPSAPRFDDSIKAFEAADRVAPPPSCATLFVGSSTVRFWTSLAQDFPDYPVINRGYGGSTVWEANAYFDRLVAHYKPSRIVFYAGENDINEGRTPDDVYADFANFMAKKDKALGQTPVWFVSIKPAKARWALQDKMSATNDKVKALAEKRPDLAYIDIVPAMLGPDGQPKDVFLADRLHMTPAGYALWAPIVKDALAKGQKVKAPGC